MNSRFLEYDVEEKCVITGKSNHRPKAWRRSPILNIRTVFLYVIHHPQMQRCIPDFIAPLQLSREEIAELVNSKCCDLGTMTEKKILFLMLFTESSAVLPAHVPCNNIIFRVFTVICRGISPPIPMFPIVFSTSQYFVLCDFFHLPLYKFCQTKTLTWKNSNCILSWMVKCQNLCLCYDFG